MIKSLLIENFKCFKNCYEIEFGKVNVIYGNSNTGKSTIIHAIKLPIKTFSTDPIIKDVDFSYNEIREILPNRDISKTLRIVIKGDLKLPYVESILNYIIDFKLSVSDGTLCTGIEIEDLKITIPEMLQSMFAYVIKEIKHGKYSIRFEGHYLMHSIYNVKVIYPRITIIDRETYTILYIEILPKLFEKFIKIIPDIKLSKYYSCKPTYPSKYCELVNDLLENPEIKEKLSHLISKVLGTKFIFDIRKLQETDEFLIENVVNKLNVSLESTTLLNLMYIFTKLLLTPKNGTLVIEKPDQDLDLNTLKQFLNTLVNYCIDNNIQLIITTTNLLTVGYLVKTCLLKGIDLRDIKIYQILKHEDSSKIIEKDVNQVMYDIRYLLNNLLQEFS